ncbi:SLAM family member 8-like [Gracilinanus agilis]|uniref:SLAM family member 8-like n=1 Tax=Gracilinanus agilis TaxID=191870 RepID=UPI001CFDE421|nr:SLAM family member 8-like [Gracilinanus agilis]
MDREKFPVLRMRRILQLLLLFLQSQKGTQKKEAKDSHHTVDGIVGGSILFPLNVSLETEIQEIEWRFKSEQLQLLSLKPGASSFLWYSPLDRYKGRLEVLEDSSLIIRKLTPKDSGLYEVRIIFISGVFIIQTFVLSVYDPIPVPQIHIQSQCLTSFWCNITLDCRVSEPRTAVTVTWRGWNLLSTLEKTEISEVSSNSRTLSLSLPRNQSNSSLTCLVSNPVDQRNITINLRNVCALRDTYASNKASKEPVNMFSCPMKWMLLWKGLLLLGILLWTLGIRFTGDKGQAEEGQAKKNEVNRRRQPPGIKNMHTWTDYCPQPHPSDYSVPDGKEISTLKRTRTLHP